VADDKDAQKQLQDAVERMVAFHREDDGGDPDHGVLTDWIVVACSEGFDGDEQTAVYYTLYPNGTLADHKALGLLEAGKVFITKGLLR
jgi:hypothetical protein